MIQISIDDLIKFSVPLVFLVTIVGWLFKEWIGSRIDKSIQHEYDFKLEKYRFQQLQRQKAEVVAKFFARWKKYHGNEEKYLERNELIDYYEELNQMSIELSLWIPDKDILTNIMKRLGQGNKKGDAKDIRELIGDIRKMILDDKGDSFNPQDIIFWDNLVEKIINQNNPEFTPYSHN